jgi:Hint module
MTKYCLVIISQYLLSIGFVVWLLMLGNGRVHAFSDGAGGCDGNGPAVAFSHLNVSKTILKVNFATEGVKLTIGTTIIPEGGTANVVVSTATPVKITGTTMKGSLCRLSAPGGYVLNDTITPAMNTKIAPVCEYPVIGITHTNPTEKDIMSGTLNFNTVGTGIIADVTVVWYNNETHSKYGYGQYKINVVPKPTPPIICFSGENTVQEQKVGRISLTQLKIGDMIRTIHDKYTQVYGFGHYDPDRIEDYIRIGSQPYVVVAKADDDFGAMVKEHFTNHTGMTIEVSTEHLVFLKQQHYYAASFYPVRAMDVQIGDELSSGNIVTTIEAVQRRGVYAPLTQSGDMMISGFHVSNYVQVLHENSLSHRSILHWNQHIWGHFIFSPQRWFCWYFLEYCKKETYVNGYGVYAYLFVGAWMATQRLLSVVEIMLSILVNPITFFMNSVFLVVMTMRFIKNKIVSGMP